MTMLRRYFPKQYFIPVVLLLGTTFGCLFGLLYSMTATQDQMEAERERQSVNSATARAVEVAIRDLQDYAIWDDAVRHIAIAFDREWIDDNIAAYLVTFQEYEHLFVIDNLSSRTIYSSSTKSPTEQPTAISDELGQGAVQGLRSLNIVGDDQLPITGGFSRQGDRLFLYSAAHILPLTNKVELLPGRDLSIVIAKELSPSYLQIWRNRQQTKALALSFATPAEDTQFQPIRDRDGNILAYLTWHVESPGRELMRRILPGFVLIGLISLLAAWAILQRARMATEALHRSKQKAQYLANHDSLTGLPNRRELLGRLRSISPDHPFHLLYIDLDGFKETNDVYGHATGDELLRESAVRLSRAVGPEHLIVRAGGDELAVLILEIEGKAVEKIADRILREFDAPFRVSGYNIAVGASIGIAGNYEPIDEEEIIRRADLAMYAAKTNGKNGWCHYDPEMNREIELRREIEGSLRLAIDNDAIDVVFQPIVDARTGKIVNVEALARWTDPVLGAIPPDKFIPVAEQSGLITRLGRNVLIKACRAARDWDVDLSVNLSPAQFWDRGLGSRVQAILEAEGFPAHRLELEITERYLLRRPDDAERILQSLRSIGVRIALDDFGCGFASIGYLQRLSLDAIKIDRSFVEKVATDVEAADLARAIVALGLALKLSVTAEGVETEDQARVMKLFGCTHIQGWLHGRPVPASVMQSLLDGSRMRQAAG
ncbi:putative bifunctional diguanylate cyclase/phosphodiesterase [Terrihabitans sp. B22-R8]|uniref:putative bifunctional diguanylate cyclase/phosphodiesterase n=1 Tax=Terrihabitans sp. B22-R8 TaxID=3425128 RepID=UPI00403C233C